MTIFRLTQITDSHLSRRHQAFTDNFQRVSQYIDDTLPDLVINSGDLGFNGYDHPDDLSFAKAQHDALSVPCRFLPGNHDIGDNPTRVGAPLTQPASEERLSFYQSIFGEDRWHFEAAGWSFVGLNSLVMNTPLAREDEQFDWLAEQLASLHGRPLAVFIHKPLFLNAPDDPELAASAIRYVPQPARARLIDMLGKVDLRLVACGHVHQRRDFTYRHVRHIWAPSTGFILKSNERQELMGVKEVGLVEYVFQPDSFEVRHVRAPGQVDTDLFGGLEPSGH